MTRSVVVVLALVVAGCAADSQSPDTQTQAPAPLPSSLATTEAPDSTAPLCTIEPAQLWLTEGQTARAQIDCAVELRAEAMPAGIVVGDRELVWQPALDQAGVHRIELEGEGVALTWTVAVADAFDDPANIPVVEPELLTHEYGLEVLHLHTGDSLSTEFAPATLVHDGRSVPAELRVRGALSLEYPKPNFAVRLDEPFSGTDPRLDRLDQLVLVAGFDDNSLLRNRLAQQLWADIAPTHLTVAHASVVVYLDGEYLGVYTLLESVDDQYLRRHDLDPDGQLFKAEDVRADFRLDDDPDPRAGFEKKSGEPEEGPAALGPIADLVEFVAESDAEQFAVDLEQWVEVDEVIDWFAFVSFISAGDSANKNAYWYQGVDQSTFRYVPWDFNHSFGQDFLTVRLPADEQLAGHFVGLNGLFERIWADAALRTEMIGRYRSLLAGPLAPERLGEMVDDLEAELGTNLVRNDQRWGATYHDFRLWADRDDVTDGAGELDDIRRWVSARHGAVTAELAAAQATA